MQEFLKDESQRLARSWMRHDQNWLGGYLVAGVEDPRINLQSILTRHFLTRALTGDQFSELMREECRFGAAINWLCDLARRAGESDDLTIVRHCLGRGADNAEGIEIPAFVAHAFRTLPRPLAEMVIPNYVESFLAGSHPSTGLTEFDQPSLDTFISLWRAILAADQPAIAQGATPKVVEVACGSANDYRFMDQCGLAKCIRYTGFDLCDKNIANARALFPTVDFRAGNAFEIPAVDREFDLCCAQDLFEHLSLEALPVAITEVCRVTRLGLCLGFFNLDEIPDHVARPVDEYHWNTLSLARLKEHFLRAGFSTQVIHVGTFLWREFGCGHTHNPNAYTLLLSRDR